MEKFIIMMIIKFIIVILILLMIKYVNLDFMCKFGDVYWNRDFVGGLGVGNFIDKGVVNIIEDCMKMCCVVKDCFVVYMVESNCFVISCKERE